MASFRSPLLKRYLFGTTIYTLVVLLLQIQWVSRLPHPALRIDLILPLMFGVAVEWPAAFSILWACGWGFVADVFSGRFWGFHVGSYVVVVCLVNMTSERFELHNPVYQMFFVGLCALAQSLALGMFLLMEASGMEEAFRVGMNLLFRSLFTVVVAPIVTYVLWNLKDGSL